jgi:hypothetical protein
MLELDERVDLILGLSPSSPNRKVQGLDLLYGMTLKRAFEALKVEMRSCAQKLLTVTVLANPLGPKPPKQVDALLQPLRLVLHVVETSGLVATLHSSFPEHPLNFTLFPLNNTFQSPCIGLYLYLSLIFNCDYCY